MTDALLVLAVLFAPTVLAMWLLARRRRRRHVPPPLTPADVEVFGLEIANCDDVIDALEREKP